jgi:hypothetical protein
LQKTAAALHFLKEVIMVKRDLPVAVLKRIVGAASSTRWPGIVAGVQSRAEA